MLFAFSLVAARAILSASNTSLQTPDAGDLIAFNDVITEIGATTGFTGTTFTCPSTAYYFVNYRLRISRRDNSRASNCRVDLISCGAITVSL